MYQYRTGRFRENDNETDVDKNIFNIYAMLKNKINFFHLKTCECIFISMPRSSHLRRH